VQGLEKSYQEPRVLRSVDFEVTPGSIFALPGSNGAGKMERMLDLLRERGWAGWTRLERLTEPPG
jgi:ABC-type uncharacterized transport system ATPase subunit